MKTQTNFKFYLTKLRGLTLTLITLLMLGVVQVHADSWTKVTSAPASWAGEYLLVYESSSTAGKAWTGVDEASCGADVTISSGIISTKPDAAVSITVAAVTGGYSIKINGGTNNGKYLGRSANSNGMDIGTSAVKNTFSYDDNSNSVKIVGAGNAVLRYNSTSGQYRFRYFKSSSYTSQQPIQLYKKQAASTPSLTATPTSLDWGSVAKGASLSTKTFSISGSNLTSGSLTIAASSGWSVSPTSKTVNGTLSATTITVTPPSTATVGTKNGTITISGGGLASNVSVSCSLTVLETYTCTWHAGSGTQHTQTAVSGTALTDPGTPSAATYCPGGKIFVGWTASEISGESSTAPTDLFTSVSGLTMPSSNKHYYAVFATGDKTKWDRITSSSNFITGNYLIVSEEAGDALKNATLSKDYWFDVQSVTISSNTITTSDANIIWKITKSSSNYTIYNEAVSKWLAIVTSGSYKNLNLSNSSCNFTASFSSNAVTLSANSSQITRSTSYTEYLAGPSQTSNKIYLYKQRLSAFATTCCTALGTINGSIIFINVLWV